MKADLQCIVCNVVYEESAQDDFSEIIPGVKPISHGICSFACEKADFKRMGLPEPKLKKGDRVQLVGDKEEWQFTGQVTEDALYGIELYSLIHSVRDTDFRRVWK